MGKEESIQIMMIQDKIIAAQQECEEACLQSDTPDYRMLYFRLFARMEEVRQQLTAAAKAKDHQTDGRKDQRGAQLAAQGQQHP